MTLMKRKLPLSRSSTPSSSFWLSHIARYAPEPARRNLAHCCDPDVNIFCGMGSYRMVSPKKDFDIAKRSPPTKYVNVRGAGSSSCRFRDIADYVTEPKG